MGNDSEGAFAPLILALFALLTAMAEFNGIVRIGEFDGDMGVLSRQPDGFSVKIERGR